MVSFCIGASVAYCSFGSGPTRSRRRRKHGQVEKELSEQIPASHVKAIWSDRGFDVFNNPTDSIMDVSLVFTALTFGKLDPNSLAPVPQYRGRERRSNTALQVPRHSESARARAVDGRESRRKPSHPANTKATGRVKSPNNSNSPPASPDRSRTPIPGRPAAPRPSRMQFNS